MCLPAGAAAGHRRLWKKLQQAGGAGEAGYRLGEAAQAVGFHTATDVSQGKKKKERERPQALPSSSSDLGFTSSKFGF